MLSELSQGTILRRASPADKEEMLKRFPRWHSSRFTFDECLDQEKFLFLIEQEWNVYREMDVLQGYMVANKWVYENENESGGIAEILHWGPEPEQHSLESMWITTLEQLYAEGIEKIHSPAAVALALPTQRTLGTQEIVDLDDIVTVNKMVKQLEYPVDILKLILSYSFFPRNSCRVKRGESSWECRTDDNVWAVAEILGWTSASASETLLETVYLVRHYTHYNASHL